MNLHEYQAKELLKKYNVPVQEGVAVETVDAAAAAYATLKAQTGNNFAVIKAQIHAGGRGKGKIEGKEQRGVAVAKSEDDVKTIAGNLLDMLKNIVPANDARKNLSRVVPSLLIDGLTIAGK